MYFVCPFSLQFNMHHTQFCIDPQICILYMQVSTDRLENPELVDQLLEKYLEESIYKEIYVNLVSRKFMQLRAFGFYVYASWIPYKI